MYGVCLVRMCPPCEADSSTKKTKMSQLKLPPYQKRKTSTTRPTTLAVAGIGSSSSGGTSQGRKISLGYGIQSPSDCPLLPEGFQPLHCQVAGHAFHKGTDSLGLLKCVDDGSVLKPAAKLLAGAREVKFYEQINGSSGEVSKELLLLREITPQYRGNQKLVVNGELIEFLKLEDLTQGMLEPCIMDIKIGRRSWDPMATEEKRRYEMSKYVESREAYGFCIPGFQFYSLQTGRLQRYGKEYGKKLNEVTVRDAMRKFLNADVGFCRQQLIQFLTDLWNIQKWARTQTSVRLYASSVLLVYDARRLKPVLQHSSKKSPRTPTMSPVSLAATPSRSSSKSTTPTTPTFYTTSINELGDVEPLQHYFKIQRSHSINHNYEEEIKTMKENYTFMLDNLVGSYEEKVWAKARMIDFAHTFPVQSTEEKPTIDRNYLEGIDNIVKLFEGFLKDCEIQNSILPSVP